MKKLLKSEICGSVNSTHRALFTGKVKYFGYNQKKKKKKTQNVRLPLESQATKGGETARGSNPD